ncbi:hypothetical protein [Mesorhizobium sp. B1-1-7]|uniref:hypothetical protein n=1 Tax=Mesorhizobium sp. B1-1-7 TaxID=2589977 RepID=UPI001127BE1F|nr:hypothetical protein [Mesorhizobium sp. B1-1-7]TPN44870.1 hypothetical protein FJ978_28225 [Mesorhizobium sp. B1-1-7]
MDWQALLYAPIYATLGVEAVLTVACGDPPIKTGADGGPLLVLDKTASYVTGIGGRFQAEVMTVTPSAIVRAVDLVEIDREKLHDAELVFNGKTWLIDTFAPKPSPNGEADGELLLFLKDR